MCGRYALALRPQQVRAYFEDEHMPVSDAPEDDAPDAPRQSYNFAPGYHGLVYRADVPDHGAGPVQQHKKSSSPPTGEKEGEEEEEEEAAADVGATYEPKEVRYKLQSMKWGLIPFWTKRNPDYGSMLKTINCRADSLAENKGMWTSMKQRKRCVVVFQGFYEWLKKGREKVPHYIKRRDGQLMCAAGLWDCVQYEGSDDKHYTYTVITTDSNAQLKFLHDRMPVFLENGSEHLRTWLDPGRHTWSKELQSLLKPYEGELDVYPVSKEVGKVGNNSPNFIVPVASRENKSNIANFFAPGPEKKEAASHAARTDGKAAAVDEDEESTKEATASSIKHEEGEDRETVDRERTEDNAPLPVPTEEARQGVKRELDDVPADDEPPLKISKPSAPTGPAKTAAASSSSSSSSSAKKTVGRSRSATSNGTASPSKAGTEKGSMKITSFFGK